MIGRYLADRSFWIARGLANTGLVLGLLVGLASLCALVIALAP